MASMIASVAGLTARATPKCTSTGRRAVKCNAFFGFGGPKEAAKPKNKVNPGQTYADVGAAVDAGLIQGCAPFEDVGPSPPQIPPMFYLYCSPRRGWWMPSKFPDPDTLSDRSDHALHEHVPSTGCYALRRIAPVLVHSVNVPSHHDQPVRAQLLPDTAAKNNPVVASEVSKPR
jgi:hypothetical protein